MESIQAQTEPIDEQDHSPSKRGKRDSIKKIVQDKSEKVAAEQLNASGGAGGSLEVAEASANASSSSPPQPSNGQRPDVVPGSVDDSTADSEESGIVAGTSSFRHHHNSGGKPKHKRQDQVQQSLSYNHSSIHTTTWTEGT